MATTIEERKQRQQRSLFETNCKNLRVLLRKRMELFAKSHRGCDKPRGCGCQIDHMLDLLAQAEASVFQMEINSYSSDPHGGYDHYENGKED